MFPLIPMWVVFSAVGWWIGREYPVATWIVVICLIITSLFMWSSPQLGLDLLAVLLVLAAALVILRFIVPILGFLFGVAVWLSFFFGFFYAVGQVLR
jgi:hypothetical protein